MYTYEGILVDMPVLLGCAIACRRILCSAIAWRWLKRGLSTCVCILFARGSWRAIPTLKLAAALNRLDTRIHPFVVTYSEISLLR